MISKIKCSRLRKRLYCKKPISALNAPMVPMGAFFYYFIPEHFFYFLEEVRYEYMI